MRIGPPLHHTKYECKIPMRDGVKLFTAVYVPNDKSETYPFILFRTPYAVSPYGANAYPHPPRTEHAVCS